MDPDEFYVERIVAKRSINNRIEYLIKWLNYPESDNSWEPLDNIYCTNLVDQFERELKENHSSLPVISPNFKCNDQRVINADGHNDEVSFGSNDLCTLENILPDLFDSDNEVVECKDPDLEVVLKDLTTSGPSRQLTPKGNCDTYTGFPQNDVTAATKSIQLTVRPHLTSGQYSVERILDKRYDENGRLFYYVKWNGLPIIENSWEPLENLNCRELIKSFEREWEKSHHQVVQGRGGKKTPSIPSSSSSDEYNSCRNLKRIKRMKKSNLKVTRKKDRHLLMSEDVFGFERGLELRKIIGVHRFCNETYYIVKWKGTNLPDIVPSKVIYERNPKKVASFLETRVKVQPATPTTIGKEI